VTPRPQGGGLERVHKNFSSPYLHFVRCGVPYCSAVRDLRRVPPPSLGVSSLDLGRLLASGPFSLIFQCMARKNRGMRLTHFCYASAARPLDEDAAHSAAAR